MTTETFGGGHGAPSTVAFYAPGQARNVLGEFDKEDGSGEQTDWEKAKGMTPDQWAKLSDGQKAALLAAVYVADADKKPGASAALAKLRGWVASGKGGKGKGKGGSGGGSGKKSGKSDAQKKSEAAKKKADADKKRAASALNARRVRPDAVNSAHRDGYIIGESQDGSSRMRWDKAHETYVVEKKDGKGWKEARRLKAEQAYNELAKSNAAWYRPKVQPYLKPEAKKSTKKTTTKTSPTSNGPAINEGVVTRRPTPRAQTHRRPTPRIRKKKALTAASEVHTGAMIALIPREDIVASLAVDGGESADQLHMTEIYLGDAADFDDEDRAYVVDVVSDFANGYDVVDGDAFSVNMFNPPGNTQEDGKQRDACVVLGISGDEVADFHDELRAFLEDSEIDFPEQHRPRIPHVTLVYTDDADLSYFTDRTGPITFDTIRIAFGEDVYDIPLGEGEDETDDDMTASAAHDQLLKYGPIVPNILMDLATFTKEKDVNQKAGPGHNLRNYWVKGEGAAKIGWKTPGDWTRCVASLGKYVKDPKGLCSEYHHQATGMWPGDKRNPGMEDDTTAFDTEMLYDVDGAAEGGEKMTASAAEEVDKTTEEVDKTADEPMPTEEMDRPAAWEGVLTVEGIESGDSRMFAGNALTWDELPLPLRWQKEGAHGGQNDVTVSVGNIEKIWREPAPDGRAGVNFIKGSGTIDLGNPDGAEVYRRMKRGYMRGNSVDVDSVKGADVELTFPESAAEQSAEGDVQIFDMSKMQPELTTYNKGRIRATTLVEIPAFTEARLELVSDDAVTMNDQSDADDEEEPVADDEGDDEVDEPLVQAVNDKIDAIVAAATTIQISDAPPREWFNEPKDVTATGALTVTAEGRIYGYVAPLGVRHRSFTNKDVKVPTRRVDYSRYMGGETIVADGGRVSTGAITMNCGHASTSASLTASQAAQHYDNTCSMVASVRVGENRHGVWMAGALLPDVTADQVRRIMASRLSGDWRAHLDKPGWREFVAALLVPVPGFPMARSAPSVTASEGVLVASSVPVHFLAKEEDEEGEVNEIPQDEEEEKRLSPKMQVQARIKAVRLATMRARIEELKPVATTADRVTALRSRVDAFHGTHNQSTHGHRYGPGGELKSRIGKAADKVKKASGRDFKKDEADLKKIANGGSAKDRMKGASPDGWKARKDGGFMKTNPATGTDHLIAPAGDGTDKWVHRYATSKGGVTGTRHSSKEDAMKDAERVIKRDVDAKSGGGTSGSGSTSLGGLYSMKKADRAEKVKTLDADTLASLRKENMSKLAKSRGKNGASVFKNSQELLAAEHLDVILRQAQIAQGKKVNTAGLPKK